MFKALKEVNTPVGTIPAGRRVPAELVNTCMINNGFVVEIANAEDKGELLTEVSGSVEVTVEETPEPTEHEAGEVGLALMEDETEEETEPALKDLDETDMPMPASS